MSVMEEVLKVLQNVVAPKLEALNEKLNASNDRIDNLRNEMKLRFDAINDRLDDLKQRMELERRVEHLERERDERRAS